VAEALAHHFSGLVGQEQQRGAGVPQVVQPDVGQPGPHQDRLERVLAQVTDAQVATRGVAEHGAVGAVEPRGEHRLAVLRQRGGRRLAHLAAKRLPADRVEWEQSEWRARVWREAQADYSGRQETPGPGPG
jgi:hypothetical protein